MPSLWYMPMTMVKKLNHQVTQTMDQDSYDSGIGLGNGVADLGIGLQTISLPYLK